jgi:hypothetical protein
MRSGDTSKVWTVQIDLEETHDQTEAKAVLLVGDEELGGWGRARRNPADPEVPRIGEELAAARALSDLAHKLLEEAVRAIETHEGRRLQRPVTA